MPVTSTQLKTLAQECGFELTGVAAVGPLDEVSYYREWLGQGMAGEMHYLEGHRGDMRADPRSLLASARSMLCVGRLYQTAQPHTEELRDPGRGWISRYAWGEDYHRTIRRDLERLAARLGALVEEAFEWKVCVDTAPLLERAWARRAGLGWIGRNTCLINQPLGSWFLLGELLLSLELEPDAPPPDRCGSCTRCIDACPTQALVPTGRAQGPAFALDSRLCISYFTIELRGPIPEAQRAGLGQHVFGCDICQDVCPWNRKAAATADPAFAPRTFAPPLEELAAMSAEQFHETFRATPVSRAKYSGFLRNVAVAMGNSGQPKFREPLERLAASPDPLVRSHAEWALERLEAGPSG